MHLFLSLFALLSLSLSITSNQIFLVIKCNNKHSNVIPLIIQSKLIAFLLVPHTAHSSIHTNHYDNNDLPHHTLSPIIVVWLNSALRVSLTTKHL